MLRFNLIYDDLMSKTRTVFGHEVNLLRLGWSYGWNDNKTRYGVCKFNEKRIELSRFLFQNEQTPEEVIDTILHEIAHAIDYEYRGESDHSYKWKQVCRVIGARPVRCGKMSDPALRVNNAKWEYTCPSCETKSYKFKRTKGNACGKCCRTYNNSRYTEKYRLIEKQLR